MTNEKFDIIILGSGPAGLQAAIHAARRKVSVLVLGRLPKSSAYQTHIENYCLIFEKLAVAEHLRNDLKGSMIYIHEGRKVSEILGSESITGLKKEKSMYSVCILIAINEKMTSRDQRFYE